MTKFRKKNKICSLGSISMNQIFVYSTNLHTEASKRVLNILSFSHMLKWAKHYLHFLLLLSEVKQGEELSIKKKKKKNPNVASSQKPSEDEENQTLLDFFLKRATSARKCHAPDYAKHITPNYQHLQLVLDPLLPGYFKSLPKEYKVSEIEKVLPTITTLVTVRI